MSPPLHPGYASFSLAALAWLGSAIENGLLFFHCYCKRPRLWRHASASELAPHARPSPVSKYLHFARTNSNSSMKTAPQLYQRQSPKLSVTAGLVPAASLRRARAILIGMAGTNPAMTTWGHLHTGPFTEDSS